MRSTITHVLAAGALATAVAVPVTTVALAEPAAPAVAPARPAPSVPPLTAVETADIADERSERREVAERVAAAEERAAERRAAKKRAAERAAEAARRAAAERAAEEAAERRAAERAAAERRAAEAAAEQRSSDRASRGSGRSDVPASSGSPRSVARSMLAARGEADQFGCLDSLWNKESGWSVTADNPSSSAYGIPQALPGSKMASAGSDWRTSARTQIAWGLGYIDDVYGSPCAAWSHSQANNWY